MTSASIFLAAAVIAVTAGAAVAGPVAEPARAPVQASDFQALSDVGSVVWSQQADQNNGRAYLAWGHRFER